MAPNQSVRICTHIKPSGHRCGSPALRGEIFCYFHQRVIRGVRTPPKSRLHPIAILDDPKAIQISLMEMINALVRNTIDYRRAQLILRALHMAAKNSRNVNFESKVYPPVEEIPEYPEPRQPRKRKQAVPSEPPATPKTGPYFPAQSQEEWDDIWKKIAADSPCDPNQSGKFRLPAPAPPPARNGAQPSTGTHA